MVMVALLSAVALTPVEKMSVEKTSVAEKSRHPSKDLSAPSLSSDPTQRPTEDAQPGIFKPSYPEMAGQTYSYLRYLKQ
jgi:hypothetical protein